MDPLTKNLIEKSNQRLVENFIQKAAEKKVPGFRQRYKESMKFVDQNWFTIKDTFGGLYGAAIAILAGISNQPVVTIAKKLRQK